MDLSKLPRLSKTDAGDAPQPVAPPAAADVPTATPATTFCNRCGAPLRPGARFCDSCGAATAPTGLDYHPRAEAGVGAEIWVAAIIGIVLMLMGRSFGGYLLATLTGQTYHTNVEWSRGPSAGQEVAYWELSGHQALSDSAIWLFGFAMVLEAAVLALMNTRWRAKVPLLWFALFITALAMAFNLFVSFLLLKDNTIPMMSLLAVAFGGYMAVFEWRLLGQLRAAR